MISAHRLLIVFVSTLLLFVPFTRAQENTAFVVVQQPQPAAIEVLFLPAGAQSAVETQVIAVPELWWLTEVHGSSTAATIALIFRTVSHYAIVTYNLVDKSVTTIVNDVFLPPPGSTLMAESQDIAFSGRYLAYNSIVNEVWAQQVTTIYDAVNTDQWQLNTGPGLPSQLAWSPDGERIAVVVTDCQTTCSASLQIHSVISRDLIQRIEISETIPESATFENSGVCQLAWSPNGQYLAFMANCERASYAHNKEIYIVEQQTGNIMRVTDFTFTQERLPPLYAVLAEYVIGWLSGDELIISTHYGSGDGTSTMFIYNVKSQQSTTVSNVYYSVIDTHPATGLVLLQPSLNDDYQIQSPINALAITGEGEQIAGVESLSTDTSISGCQPDIAPDGQSFAMTLYAGGGCGGRLIEVQLRQTSSDLDLLRTQSFAVEAFAIPLGWITFSSSD